MNFNKCLISIKLMFYAHNFAIIVSCSSFFTIYPVLTQKHALSLLQHFCPLCLQRIFCLFLFRWLLFFLSVFCFCSFFRVRKSNVFFFSSVKLIEKWKDDERRNCDVNDRQQQSEIFEWKMANSKICNTENWN